MPRLVPLSQAELRMLIKGFPKLFHQTLSSYSRPAQSGLGVGVGRQESSSKYYYPYSVDGGNGSQTLRPEAAQAQVHSQGGGIQTQLHWTREHILLPGLA